MSVPCREALRRKALPWSSKALTSSDVSNVVLGLRMVVLLQVSGLLLRLTETASVHAPTCHQLQ